MTPLADLLQQGAGHAWLFIPSAIMLGALHGLEPGHSKTMMAAFIIAIQGTVKQAVLLGLAATVSHTAVVWAVALVGLHFGSNWGTEQSEPYFQMGSAVLIIGVAVWMLVRTWRDHQAEKLHDHHHGHSHDEVRLIDLDHWTVAIEVFEDGVPPRFRLRFQQDGKPVPPPGDVVTTVEIERADNSRRFFVFVNQGDYLESMEQVPEPHEFIARLKVAHDGHSHDYDVEFVERDHGHHVHPEYEAMDLTAPGYQDAHELAHANDIRRRFTDQKVTTGQIIMFGLTGGLIPCPASITVLLLCLQLKQITLGVTLVLCFSIGLAATMVASGTLAALSLRHVSQRWSGFGTLARRAPYFSSGLVLLVGLYTGYMGWVALT